jgi:hypothetical protein
MNVGLMESVQRAAPAIDALIVEGSRPSEIGLLMTDRAAERAFGHAEVRDGTGALSTFSGAVHALAAELKPIAPLGTVGAGLVGAGPLAAVLVSALGARGGIEQALDELGLSRDAAEVARRLSHGAVLVSAPAGDADAQRALPTASVLFWRLPHAAPLTRSALVTEPLAPVPDRSARYRPVIESPDEANRSSVGASKRGT